jgi:hypothetical protein
MAVGGAGFSGNIQAGPKTSERKDPAGRESWPDGNVSFSRVRVRDMNVKSVLSYSTTRSKLYDPDKEGVSIMFGFDNQTAEKLAR